MIDHDRNEATTQMINELDRVIARASDLRTMLHARRCTERPQTFSHLDVQVVAGMVPVLDRKIAWVATWRRS